MNQLQPYLSGAVVAGLVYDQPIPGPDLKTAAEVIALGEKLPIPTGKQDPFYNPSSGIDPSSGGGHQRRKKYL